MSRKSRTDLARLGKRLASRKSEDRFGATRERTSKSQVRGPIWRDLDKEWLVASREPIWHNSGKDWTIGRVTVLELRFRVDES